MDDSFSEDEGSVGSLAEFIVSDNSSIEIEDGAEVDIQPEVVDSFTISNGIRRSNRMRKDVQPYIDDEHLDLILDGRPADIKHLVNSGSEDDDEDEEEESSWDEEEEESSST